MFYVPEELINDNNFYSYNGANQTLTVYSQCENNNCTCTDVYTSLDYLKSEDYLCSMNNIHVLSSTPTSSNYYRVVLFYCCHCLCIVVMCLYLLLYVVDDALLVMCLL